MGQSTSKHGMTAVDSRPIYPSFDHKITFQGFNDHNKYQNYKYHKDCISDRLPIPVVVKKCDGSSEGSFHISCISDRPEDTEEYAGLVLYAKWDFNEKKWKTAWNQNGKRIKAGYIIIVNSKKLQKKSNDPGVVHGALFRYAFNETLVPENYVGSGFAKVKVAGRWKTEWRYNSGVFNTADNCRTTPDERGMNLYEMDLIKKAINTWMQRGVRNFVPDSAVYINYVKP